MFRRKKRDPVTGFAALAAGLCGLPAIGATPAIGTAERTHWGLIEQYCFDCHNTTDWAGGTAFDTMCVDALAGVFQNKRLG